MSEQKHAERNKNGHMKNCPNCHGTGCIYTIPYDPPEQCDCNDTEPDWQELCKALQQENKQLGCAVERVQELALDCCGRSACTYIENMDTIVVISGEALANSGGE